MTDGIISVENDTLSILNPDSSVFHYRLKDPKSHTLQQTIFKQKQSIIENCLFGVDINPKSVQICRLRLWIELLKHTYYRADGTMEILPNIDINIKCGNSLVSKYPVKVGESLKSGKGIKEYKQLVVKYKRASEKTLKHDINKKIYQIKSNFMESGQYDLFNLENENAKIDKNSIYLHGIEWFIEFPEVLDDAGKFMGFDVIIANPPYIKDVRGNKTLFEQLKLAKPNYYLGKSDIWYMFGCFALDLLKPNGHLAFIAHNNWVTSHGAKILRDNIITRSELKTFIDFRSFMVFENALIQTMVMIAKAKVPPASYSTAYTQITDGKTARDVLDGFLNKNIPNMGIESFVCEVEPAQWRGKFFNFVEAASLKSSLLKKIWHCGTYTIPEKAIAQGIAANPDIINSRNIKLLGSKQINTGDGVFVVSSTELANLNLNKAELGFVKTFHTNILPYTRLNTSSHILYLTPKNCPDISIYPNLEAHLKKYKPVMDKRRETLSGAKKWFHLHWERNESFFKGDKILCLRKSPERPAFLFDTSDYYCGLSLNIIKPDDIDPRFLTALLNSKLIAFWLNSKGKMQGDNYQVDAEPIGQIPIVWPAGVFEKPIQDAIAQVLVLKAAQASTDIAGLEAQIDRLVYQLYGLTEAEVELVEMSV